MLNLPNMFRRKVVLSSIFLLLFPSLSQADWIWIPETGNFVNPKWEVKPTPEDQLEYAESFRDQGDCKKALVQYKMLIKAYPRAKEAPEAEFFSGQCLESMNKPY